MAERLAHAAPRDIGLQAAMAEVITRRARSEPISDEEAMAAYPQFMPALAERLRALRLVEEAEFLAETPVSPTTSVAIEPGSLPEECFQIRPDAFEGYELVAKVHRGGQGVVYRARQTRTHRDVAIKVMREGPFRTSQDQARFDREVRILAQLRHANIVAIHDRGVSAEHHFFVMDYIEGRPLDRYLAESGLSGSQIVELFLAICDALDCAHARGVIHRDLKPGNILVDTQGNPHILDFGLAKFTGDAGLIAEPTVTEPGQFLGSLPWSSPEQVRGESGEVDARTDVYALGLLMYQALTGKAPYDLDGGVREVMTSILESEPLRPGSISRGLGSDLEAIVLKCLSKPPAQRYHSAGALAEDLRRYQKGQPVLARLPTTGYFLRKLIARHKLPFASLLSLIAVLITSVITLAVLRNRALHAEQLAERERNDAIQSAESARAVNSFLIDEMLAASDPGVARGRPMTVQAVLSRAAARIDDALENQPLVEASVRETLARTYFSLGEFASAEPHARRAISLRRASKGADQEESLRVELLLAETLYRLSRYDESARVLEEVQPRTLRVLGPEHPLSLSAQFQAAMLAWVRGDLTGANAIHTRVFETRRRTLGEDHPDTLRSINEWYETAGLHGRSDLAAVPLLRRAVESSRRILGEDHPQTLRALANLGMSLAEQRKLEEADPLLTHAAERAREILGDRHADAIICAVRLGILRKEQNRCLEAQAILSRALEATALTFGEKHPLTIDARITLAGIYLRRGDERAAVSEYEQSFQRSVDRYGLEHIFSLEAEMYLAHALTQLGAHAEAREHYRVAIPLCRRVPGLDASEFCWHLRGYNILLQALNAADEARPLASELLDRRRRITEHTPEDAYQLNCYARELLTIWPEDLRDPRAALESALRAFERSSDQYHFNRFTLAQAYRANGRIPEAIAMLRRALANAPIEHSTERAMYERVLTALLEQTGKGEEASRILYDTVSRRRAALGADHVDVAQSLLELGRFQLAHNDIGAAESSAAEAQRIRERVWGADDWRTLEARLILAICAALQNRPEQGQQMLTDIESKLMQEALAPRHLLQKVRICNDQLRQGLDPRAVLEPSADTERTW